MFSFEQLISPVTVDRFFDEYVEKKPLILRRRSPTHYADLFSLEQMEEIVYRGADLLLNEKLRVVRARKGSPGTPRGESESAPLPVRGSVSTSGWLHSVYQDGYTIVANMNQASAALTRLVQQMRLLFQCEVNANAYLTPPRAQGLPVHHDAHDTIVLQLHGQKQWRLYGSNEHLPLERFSGTFVPPHQQAPRTLVLRPGDLLYLPRGYLHEARTSTSGSLHLTLGVVSYRWFEAIGGLLRQLAHSEALLRERVAFRPDGSGPASETVEAVLALAAKHLRDAKSLDAILDEHRCKLLVNSIVADRMVRPKARAAPVRQHTLVRRLVPCHVSQQAGKARIAFPGGEIVGPLSILPALRFICAAKADFAVAALPDSLGAQAKVVLVKRLITDGVLAARPGGGAPRTSTRVRT